MSSSKDASNRSELLPSSIVFLVTSYYNYEVKIFALLCWHYARYFGIPIMLEIMPA